MAGLVLGMQAALAVPARATISGGGTIAGVVDLPTYPCPSGACGGSFSGSLVATVTGTTTTGAVFVAEWPDPSTTPVGTVPINMSAAFGYGADCTPPVGVAPSLTGGGSGTFTVTGGLLTVNGLVTSHNATLSGDVSFEQVATAVPITFDGDVVTNGASTIATSLSPPLIGAGTLGFVPSAFVACPTVISVTATVAGVAAQGA
ncbi:MAG TPA: hypothetical protein VFC09_16555 [Candidatus Dormibacteraeota bacterium]|nr:hypothetical protein [Candidatus Dormibacteraeota bacterium]